MKKLKLEIAVLVSIIGVLTVIGIPQYTKFDRSYKMASKRVTFLEEFLEKYEVNDVISKNELSDFSGEYSANFPQAAKLDVTKVENIDNREGQLEIRVKLLEGTIKGMADQIKSLNDAQMPWWILNLLLPLLGWIGAKILEPIAVELGNKLKNRVFAEKKE